MSPISKRFHWSFLVVVILLTTLALQCFIHAKEAGQTTDETFYAVSGYSILRYNDYRFLGEHPPLIPQIASLPLLFLKPSFDIKNPLYVPGTDRIDVSRNGARFLYQEGNDPKKILFLERMAITALTLILGFSVFLLAGELFGLWGALLSLCLLCFCPNIIAHGSLYTTDMGLTVFYFLTIYALKRFFDHPTASTAILLGLLCGAAFMTKVSSLILIPIITLLFLIYGATRLDQTPIPGTSASFEKWMFGIAAFLLANLLGEKQAMVLFGPFVLFAFYLFARDLPLINDSKISQKIFRVLVWGGAFLCAYYAWRLKKKFGISIALFSVAGIISAAFIAALFARIPNKDSRIRLLKYYLTIWLLAALVTVVGYTDILYKFHRFIAFGSYMKPLDIVFSHSSSGHGACIDGSFIQCNKWYFPGVMAIKTPLLTLVLVALGTIFLIFSKRSLLIKTLIIVPLGAFLGAAILNKINIGLRHILPIYPFLFLLAGIPGAVIAKLKIRVLKIFFGGLLAIFLTFSIVRVAANTPHQLAYFNELVPTAERGAQLVADSNLNWGQDNQRLAEFVITQKIPSIKIISEAMNADIYNYNKIPWEHLSETDSLEPAPGYYALGIGYYMRLQNNPRSWFYKKTPEARVGKTFYIFKVSQQN